MEAARRCALCRESSRKAAASMLLAYIIIVIAYKYIRRSENIRMSLFYHQCMLLTMIFLGSDFSRRLKLGATTKESVFIHHRIEGVLRY